MHLNSLGRGAGGVILFVDRWMDGIALLLDIYIYIHTVMEV